MKKISIILIVFALAMTMSQCKKNEVQLVSNDEVVAITLNLSNNNGSKVNVNPATGTVDFESGDKIYVGSGGKYVGFLTHNGTNFSGNITNPTENQPLQFYFLGNVTPQETLSAGTTEECSVIISDQTEHLPVISCAASNENYVSGVTAYSAHLLNKCALVKFNVTTPSNSPICITGMKNKVTVDFANNTLTPSQDGEGMIMLSAGSGENVEKWAILLPQEALEEGEEGSAYSEDGNYTGIRPEIPTITENGYLTNGIAVTVNTASVPIGAINGLFSVSATKQVYFSQGNLQYQASTSTWRFAEHQWDYVGSEEVYPYPDNNPSGTVEGSSNHLISSTYNGWIDYFGWGTSGWNNGNMFCHPYDFNDSGNSSYGWGYGPTDGLHYDYSLTDLYANADWGVWNSILNGGGSGLWRTLSYEEWNYLFNLRSTSSNIRYAKALINGTNGIIILPDDWNTTNYSLNNVNNPQAQYCSNEITLSQWEILNSFNAVFLPAGGHRNGLDVYYPGDVGGYWSSSCVNSSDAYELYFNDVQLICYSNVYKYQGHSVRLVYDYNP